MMMRQFRFDRAVRGCRALAAALLCIAGPAHAQEAAPPAAPKAPASLAGDYVHSQMELVAGIRLNADGTFLYGLTVGSLDESAKGRWEAIGNRIRLTSDPRPVAPTITAGRVEAAPGKPFAIRVLAPNGRDVPGVDLRIEFDTGEPLESYLAGGPWSLPPDETRAPRFVTFSMASYRLHSERLPLDARTGSIATFALTPNDFGVIDLSEAQAEIHGETLTLHRPEGVMQFKRTKD
jgi:hypothetical protein